MKKVNPDPSPPSLLGSEIVRISSLFLLKLNRHTEIDCTKGLRFCWKKDFVEKYKDIGYISRTCPYYLYGVTHFYLRGFQSRSHSSKPGSRVNPSFGRFMSCQKLTLRSVATGSNAPFFGLLRTVSMSQIVLCFINLRQEFDAGIPSCSGHRLEIEIVMVLPTHVTDHYTN